MAEGTISILASAEWTAELEVSFWPVSTLLLSPGLNVQSDTGFPLEEVTETLNQMVIDQNLDLISLVTKISKEKPQGETTITHQN